MSNDDPLDAGEASRVAMARAAGPLPSTRTSQESFDEGAGTKLATASANKAVLFDRIVVDLAETGVGVRGERFDIIEFGVSKVGAKMWRAGANANEDGVRRATAVAAASAFNMIESVFVGRLLLVSMGCRCY
jgi:hypothetical protein